MTANVARLLQLIVDMTHDDLSVAGEVAYLSIHLTEEEMIWMSALAAGMKGYMRAITLAAWDLATMNNGRN